MNRKCTIPSDVGANISGDYDQLIPKILLQTFATASVPVGMYDAAVSWIKCNPEYSYHFYDDEKCRSFISSHFGGNVLSAFDKITVGAFKADLWRYCALYILGGVYADLDTVCSNSLSNFIEEDNEFISVFAGIVPGGIFNAFICCVAGHPFLERAIEKSVKNINDKGINCRHVLEITGPLCLGDAINEVTGRGRGTEYFARTYEVGGYRFRILEKVRSDVPSERKVVCNGDTVFMCKYEGYEEDLEQAGNKHWSERNRG